MPQRRKPRAKELNPLLTWEEIQLCLEYLELSPRQAGLILGGGPKAFGKYSKKPGAITQAMSNLLRVLAARPSALDLLARGADLDVEGMRKTIAARKASAGLLKRALRPKGGNR